LGNVRFAGRLGLSIVGILWLLTATPPVHAQEAMPADTLPTGSRWRNIILFDVDDFPPGFPVVNPYNVLASMTALTPIPDHTGKPHAHGHVIQVIVDGGNYIQDPPNPDGTPGGDDSLAYGNFNMILLRGEQEPWDPKGRSGKFVSWKYFIPYIPDRAYYLRLWEGDSVATAPYYQDSIEYYAEVDRGGGMIRFHEGPPIDVDWKFGPSKPRPKPAPRK
jgi:hypothetical protein